MKRLLSSLSQRPLLTVRTSDLPPSRTYGSVLRGVPEEAFDVQQNHSAQERQELQDQNWKSVEQQWEEQWESALEDRGLYRGNYTRLVLQHTLVPISFLVVFILLAFFPSYFFPIDPPPALPLTELILSISFYSLSHVTRIPLFQLSSLLIPRFPNLAAVVHRAVITLLTTLLRILPLPILAIAQTTSHHPTWRHPAFTRVWFLALGWGLADAVAGIWQSYEDLSLYRYVLVNDYRDDCSSTLRTTSRSTTDVENLGVPVIPPRFTHTISTASLDSDNHEHHEHPKVARRTSSTSHTTTHASEDSGFRTMTDDEIELAIDKDLEELLALKGREDLEEVYGMPFVRIPVFISCLIRINALIHTLGLTLLLSAAYIRSSISISPSAPFSSPQDSPTTPFQPSDNHPLSVTLPVVLIIHFALLTLHSPPILGRVGVHTASYISLLVGLGLWFAGMGVWEVVE